VSETQETSSGLGLIIGGVLVVLLVGILYFAYSGSDTPPSVDIPAPQTGMSESAPKNPFQAKPMQDQPADVGATDEPGQEIKPRAGIAATPMQRPAPPAGMAGRARQETGEPAQGAQNPPEIADLDEADPEDLPTLKQMALNDPDPERRLTAVTLLGVSENKDAIPILAAALSDQEEDVRMEAVLALADFVDDAPVEALEIALSDPSADVRYEALDVLSDIETPEAYEAMKKALNDPDEDVRELAQLLAELYADEAYAQ
jgi:hypothetical protein